MKILTLRGFFTAVGELAQSAYEALLELQSTAKNIAKRDIPTTTKAPTTTSTTFTTSTSRTTITTSTTTIPATPSTIFTTGTPEITSTTTTTKTITTNPNGSTTTTTSTSTRAATTSTATTAAASTTLTSTTTSTTATTTSAASSTTTKSSTTSFTDSEGNTTTNTESTTTKNGITATSSTTTETTSPATDTTTFTGTFTTTSRNGSTTTKEIDTTTTTSTGQTTESTTTTTAKDAAGTTTSQAGTQVRTDPTTGAKTTTTGQRTDIGISTTTSTTTAGGSTTTSSSFDFTTPQISTISQPFTGGPTDAPKSADEGNSSGGTSSTITIAAAAAGAGLVVAIVAGVFAWKRRKNRTNAAANATRNAAEATTQMFQNPIFKSDIGPEEMKKHLTDLGVVNSEFSNKVTMATELHNLGKLSGKNGFMVATKIDGQEVLNQNFSHNIRILSKVWRFKVEQSNIAANKRFQRESGSSQVEAIAIRMAITESAESFQRAVDEYNEYNKKSGKRKVVLRENTAKTEGVAAGQFVLDMPPDIESIGRGEYGFRATAKAWEEDRDSGNETDDDYEERQFLNNIGDGDDAVEVNLGRGYGVVNVSDYSAPDDAISNEYDLPQSQQKMVLPLKPADKGVAKISGVGDAINASAAAARAASVSSNAGAAAALASSSDGGGAQYALASSQSQYLTPTPYTRRSRSSGKEPQYEEPVAVNSVDAQGYQVPKTKEGPQAQLYMVNHLPSQTEAARTNDAKNNPDTGLYEVVDGNAKAAASQSLRAGLSSGVSASAAAAAAASNEYLAPKIGVYSTTGPVAQTSGASATPGAIPQQGLYSSIQVRQPDLMKGSEMEGSKEETSTDDPAVSAANQGGLYSVFSTADSAPAFKQHQEFYSSVQTQDPKQEAKPQVPARASNSGPQYGAVNKQGKSSAATPSTTTRVDLDAQTYGTAHPVQQGGDRTKG